MRLHLTLLLFSIAILTGTGFTQQSDKAINDISKAIKNMDASGLATWLNSTIDLTIASIDGNYSKKQAEIIIKDFFDKNPVKTFAVNHQGSSNDGSIYMIGTYTSTTNSVYRVYILLKNVSNSLLVHQFQFEAD